MIERTCIIDFTIRIDIGSTYHAISVVCGKGLPSIGLHRRNQFIFSDKTIPVYVKLFEAFLDFLGSRFAHLTGHHVFELCILHRSIPWEQETKLQLQNVLPHYACQLK